MIDQPDKKTEQEKPVESDDGNKTEETAEREIGDDVQSDKLGSDGAQAHVLGTTKPFFSRSTILALGCSGYFIFVLCPPLILLMTFGLAFLAPHWFHAPNSGCIRRRIANTAPPPSLEVNGIQVEESFWVNPRGMSLYTAVLLPKEKPIKAVVCFCHDYMDHYFRVSRWEHTPLVKEGIACIYIQYEGHGKSDGPLNLIPSWDDLVADAAAFYLTMAETDRFQGKPMFLMGEGLGASVAYSVYNSLPYLFSGTVLLNPHCHVPGHLLPAKWIANLFRAAKKSLGLLCEVWRTPLLGPINPNETEAIDQSDGSLINPFIVTADVLQTVKTDMCGSLDEFDAPLLVFSGIEGSGNLGKAIYNQSKSKDKYLLTPTDSCDLLKNVADWIKQRRKEAKVDWIDRCIMELEKRLGAKKQAVKDARK